MLVSNAILGLVMMGLQGSVFACSCVPDPPPEEALEQADAVFLGTIERFEVE